MCLLGAPCASLGHSNFEFQWSRNSLLRKDPHTMACPFSSSTFGASSTGLVHGVSNPTTLVLSCQSTVRNPQVPTQSMQHSLQMLKKHCQHNEKSSTVVCLECTLVDLLIFQSFLFSQHHLRTKRFLHFSPHCHGGRLTNIKKDRRA